jgi:molybdopterin-guanine dinucleotide biosynthesis protein A
MSERVFAAILAGGESRRFGADKAMADIGGAPMIARVARKLHVHAETLAIVGHSEAAAALQCVALADPPLPARGPLLGVLAALEWAHEAGADWLLTAPCDVPLIPADMAARLLARARDDGAAAAFAESASGLHSLCAVWSPSLAPALRAQLEAGAHPPVRDVAPSAPHVFFDDEGAFANVNTPEEFERLKALLRGG